MYIFLKRTYVTYVHTCKILKKVLRSRQYFEEKCHSYGMLPTTLDNRSGTYGTYIRLFQIVGGWASIYIESPLCAMDLKQPMPTLIPIKLVTPLCAMKLLALMFTGNNNIYYRNVSKTSTCVISVQIIHV